MYFHLFTLFPTAGHAGFQPVTKSEYPYADIFVFFYELSLKWQVVYIVRWTGVRINVKGKMFSRLREQM